MNRLVFTCCLFLALASYGQKVTVDISSSRDMVQLLKDMRNGTAQSEIETRLDSILNTRPYQFMFQHYNRSWRPNTLPKDVFKRMVLSLNWPALYKPGENTVADYMKDLWTAFYSALPLYEKRLSQLSHPRFNHYIRLGVAGAQQWLPHNMKVPDFYLAVLPVGRSNAFVFNGSQGYDLLQLPVDAKGNIRFGELVGDIAHESHHLGLKLPAPPKGTAKDSLLFDYLKIFIPEGSATKFVDNFPGGHTPAVNRKKGYNTTPEIDSLWKAYTASGSSFFDTMIIQMEGIAAGNITRDSFHILLGTYWLNGATKPPLYFWGAELMGVIYSGLGKAAVFEVMNDPRKLLAYYNEALQKKPSLQARFSPFPENLVAISKGIGGS